MQLPTRVHQCFLRELERSVYHRDSEDLLYAGCGMLTCPDGSGVQYDSALKPTGEDDDILLSYKLELF